MSELHRRALLETACRQLTISDLAAHTICIDPGYPAYVDQLTVVLESRGAHGVAAVEWEPIFHATSAEPSESPSFGRYRVLLAAIGSVHPACGEWFSPGAIAVTLVEEACRDRGLARLAHDALDELSLALGELGHREAVFAILGCVLLAPAARHESELPALVERLREEEQRHHGTGKRKAKAAFLWSCTRDRRTFVRWRRSIEEHLSSSLGSLRAELLGA